MQSICVRISREMPCSYLSTVNAHTEQQDGNVQFSLSERLKETNRNSYLPAS